MLLGFLHKRILILLCSFLLVTESSLAQLGSLEDSIFLYRSKALQAKQDIDQDLYNRKMMMYLAQCLGSEELWSYSFTKLSDIKFLTPSPKNVLLVTWMLDKSNFQSEYYGYLVVRSENVNKIFNLQDIDQFSLSLEKEQFSPSEWPGAVYYDFMESKESNTWFLLGYRQKDRLLDHKVVEILRLNEDTPIFGAPILEHGNSLKYRSIFTFPSDVVFPILFDKKDKRILFQRLVPDDPKFAGNYLFYHGDKEFDAYEYEKKKWRLKLDVKAQMPEKKNLSKPSP